MKYSWSAFRFFCKNNPTLLFIFILASGIRIALSYVNGYANDDHYMVIKLMVDKNILPSRYDCAICYQPKLYYLIAGGLVKIFNLTTDTSRVIISQMLNAAVGIITLVYFWLFINKQNLTKTTKLVFFGGLALNAALVGINAMGSNDSLAILLGVASCYYLSIWIDNYKLKYAVLSGVLGTLMCITKGSGFVLLYALVLYWLLHYFFNTAINKKTHIKSLVITLVVFMALVPFLGGYTNNIKTRASFISSWNTKSAPIYFFQNYKPDTQGTLNRPGVRNIATGYFTFRWMDLIQDPFISNDDEIKQIHRTSLWSQLYGRTTFGHFGQWPPTWISTNDYLTEQGRIAMFTGIIYLICFLFGLFVVSKKFIVAVISKNTSPLFNSDSFYLIVTTGFLASSIFYAYVIRDFSSMKSIYIFPGYIAYIALMVKGLQYFESKNLKYLIYIPIIILAAVNLSEMIILAKDLYLLKEKIGGFWLTPE